MNTLLKSAFLIFFTIEFVQPQTELSTKVCANTQSQNQQQSSMDEEQNTRTFLIETTLTQQELENLLNIKNIDTKTHIHQREINDNLN